VEKKKPDDLQAPKKKFATRGGLRPRGPCREPWGKRFKNKFTVGKRKGQKTKERAE